MYTSIIFNDAQDPVRYWWPGIEATSRACAVAQEIKRPCNRAFATGFKPQIHGFCQLRLNF